MGDDTKKDRFITSLQSLIDSCHDKANDGGLTQDQRELFYRAELNFVAEMQKAVQKDFANVDTAVVDNAIDKNNDASKTSGQAVDDDSVKVASSAIRQAKAADDAVLA